MNLCIQPMIPHWGGLPHSDIHGSTPARGSPWLFAACHVLHRLLVPRHPPNALLLLNRPPCTGTIHAKYAGATETRPTAKPCSAHPDAPSRMHPSSNAPEHCRNPALSTLPTPRGMNGATRPDQTEPDRDGQAPAVFPAPRNRAGPGKPPSCPARPGTHQNLIYLNKEQAPHQVETPQQTGGAPRKGAQAPA